MKWTALDFRKSVGDAPTPEESSFVANTIEFHDPDIVVGPNWVSFSLATKGRVFIPNTRMDVFYEVCKDREVAVEYMK